MFGISPTPTIIAVFPECLRRWTCTFAVALEPVGRLEEVPSRRRIGGGSISSILPFLSAGLKDRGRGSMCDTVLLLVDTA